MVPGGRACERMPAMGSEGMALGAGMRLKNEMALRDAWLPFAVWLLLSVVTFGLGWLIVSGHFFKFVIERTVVVDAAGVPVGRLVCRYDVEDRMAVLGWWLLACIVTCGVALLFYSFHAARSALDATEIEWSVR